MGSFSPLGGPLETSAFNWRDFFRRNWGTPLFVPKSFFSIFLGDSLAEEGLDPSKGASICSGRPHPCPGLFPFCNTNDYYFPSKRISFGLSLGVPFCFFRGGAVLQRVPKGDTTKGVRPSFEAFRCSPSFLFFFPFFVSNQSFLNKRGSPPRDPVRGTHVRRGLISWEFPPPFFVRRALEGPP